MPPMVRCFVEYERIDILLFYIILEAVKFVIFLYTNPRKGQKMKKIFEQDVSFHEVFLEAVPTALVMTILLVNAASGKS